MLGVLLVAVAAGGIAEQAAPAPSQDEFMEVSNGQAEIIRDAFGVPHIFAAEENDGYYALGYAQAEDRGEALLAIAMAVEGRAASVYGNGMIPWGIPALEMDRYALRWRIAEQAKAGYGRLTPGLRARIDAYAAGFRRYYIDHPQKKPAWAPEMQGWHAIAWPQLLIWSFNTGDGMRECAPLPAQVLPAAGNTGSNEWAIAPARTQGGRTFLLSDPHGAFPVGGNPFYEYRMKAGDLDVTGYAFGATPALVHSQKVAWGLTTGGPDVSDCYRIKIEGDRYRYQGQWHDLEIQRGTVVVNGGQRVAVEDRYASINGRPAPVVREADGYGYAVSTAYWGHLETMHVQFDGMIRAEDASGAAKAAAVQGMFAQNLLIADSKGHIIYIRGGRTPIRAAGIDASKAISADDPAASWLGTHPASDLVQVTDPPTGYIQNNNTLPDNMVAGAPLVRADDYPAYIWNDVAGLQFMDRAELANRALATNARFSVEDAKALAVDEHWAGADSWTAALVQAKAISPSAVAAFDPETHEVLDRLIKFDGDARADSVAALNGYFWRTALATALSTDEIHALTPAVHDPSRMTSAQALALLSAVPAAVKLMRDRVGTSDLPYGELFRIGRVPGRDYPLGGGPSLDFGGDLDRCRTLARSAFLCSLTLRAFFSYTTQAGRPAATDGSRVLRLVVLGPRFESWSVHNFGQSDDPASPHYDDQARELSSRGKLKRIPFTPAELAAETTARLTLIIPRADRSPPLVHRTHTAITSKNAR